VLFLLVTCRLHEFSLGRKTIGRCFKKIKQGGSKKNILAIPVNYQEKNTQGSLKNIDFFFKTGQGLGKMELKRM